MEPTTPLAQQSPRTTKWYRNKESLPASARTGRTVLARDLNQNAAKCFTVFATPQEAADFAVRHAKWNPGHAHLYEVTEHAEHPVHMFFDLDRRNKEGAAVLPLVVTPSLTSTLTSRSAGRSLHLAHPRPSRTSRSSPSCSTRTSRRPMTLPCSSVRPHACTASRACTASPRAASTRPSTSNLS